MHANAVHFVHGWCGNVTCYSGADSAAHAVIHISTGATAEPWRNDFAHGRESNLLKTDPSVSIQSPGPKLLIESSDSLAKPWLAATER